jgi:hypothetical protein
MTDDPPLPYVDENGVLHDPVALAIVHAVERENCRQMLMGAFRERVDHFRSRIYERGQSPSEVVIVMLNVNDPRGAQLAGVLMPDHDWDAYRARGEVPYARGLAERSGIQGLLDDVDAEQAERLRSAHVAIFMIDRGIVAAFDYTELQ